MQDIIEGNDRGLRTYKASFGSTTWESLKSDLGVQLMGVQGEPVHLFDKMFSFAEFLDEGYMRGF